MPAGYAVVPRRAPLPGKSGTVVAGHTTRTRQELIDAGDPFNPRNIVHPGDFYQEGKPWMDPGVHVNFYDNTRSTNSIMQSFFGTVSKLRFLRQANRLVRGRQEAQNNNVIIQAPPATSYGDFATYTTGTIHRG
jgi:hypothetical protein